MVLNLTISLIVLHEYLVCELMFCYHFMSVIHNAFVFLRFLSQLFVYKPCLCMVNIACLYIVYIACLYGLCILIVSYYACHYNLI